MPFSAIFFTFVLSSIKLSSSKTNHPPINLNMKIAIYSHSIPPKVDGVSRRFTSLIKELRRAGHEVLIFTLEQEPTLEKVLQPDERVTKLKYVHLVGTNHRCYPSIRIAVPSAGNLWDIGHSIFSFRPDIIHCTADSITLQFGLVGKLLGIPVVTSIHTDVSTGLAAAGNSDVVIFSANLKERMESCLLDGCATTSESFKSKLYRNGISCDHVVLTSVEIDLFSPSKRNELTRKRLTFNNPLGFLVVYVGRLAPEKGLHQLVEMCRQVEDCYLALVGDGPLGPHFQSLHGPENRLYCVPAFLSHEALPAIYASADVHITCSQFETLGNTILEAHACGTPVIAPRTQGFIDTVTDGSDGFLFDASISAEGIRAIKTLRDNPQLRTKMGKAARAKVLDKSPEMVATDYVNWYRRRAELSREQSLLSKSFGLIQLLSAVLLVKVIWSMYEVQGKIISQLEDMMNFGKSAICSSSVMQKIQGTYGTITGPLNAVEDDAARRRR